MVITVLWLVFTRIVAVSHIILNSIGGRLKSNSLICKNCNSKLGDSIDTKLSKDLNVFANLINIKRETGKPQPFKVISKKTHEEYILKPGGVPEPLNCNVERIVNDDNILKFNIKARSMHEYKKNLKDLKKI